MFVVKLDAVLNARSGLTAPKTLRIERQKMLQPKNRVSENATHETEKQHRKRVLFPILFLLRIHAHDPISEPLQRV